MLLSSSKKESPVGIAGDSFFLYTSKLSNNLGECEFIDFL